LVASAEPPLPLARAVGAEALAEIGCRLTGGRLAARLRAAEVLVAGAFAEAGFSVAAGFFAVAFAGAFFAAGFFAAGFRAGAFFAGGFFAAAAFAGAFFAAVLLAAPRFAGAFAGAFFAAGFLAGAFFAAGFFAGAFFAAVLLAAPRFAGAFAGAFLAGAFFAAGFFAALALRAAGFGEEDLVPPVDLRDVVERRVPLRSSAITLRRTLAALGGGRAIAVAGAAIGAAWLATGGVAPATQPGSYPWPERIEAAERFADGRAGTVSLAVVDEDGRLRGRHADRVHNSASVVKVMFLVAYLRQPGVRHDELTAAERDLLGPMIKRSDNQRANTVFREVGENALYRLARDARLDHFTTQPTWGLSTITAGSQARFFHRIERYIPRSHRRYALRLLARIVPSQRWGIPPAAPAGWRLHFKGGWSGRPNWRVNQVMLLANGERRLSVAVLTRDQPSKEYGQASIEGVARRLLRGYE
jgi:hypothetical protein